jgi:hypothetical protein
MKNEILGSLIKELFQFDEMHEKYTDNDISFSIDLSKEGNTLNVKVTLNENTDKKEFETWVNQLDDDIFNETWESLSEDYGLNDLNKIYESEDYNKIIDLFKTRSKEIALEKVKMLTNLFNL